MEDEADSSKEKFLSYIERLRKSGKLEHVALLDMKGKVLAFTRGLTIGTDDGFAIINMLESPYRDLTGIKVGHQNFVCFRNSENSLVGRSSRDFICCCKCVDFVIVGMSDPESQGSSIYEITRFVMSYKRKSTLTDAGRSHGNRRSTLETETTPDAEDGTKAVTV